MRVVPQENVSYGEHQLFHVASFAQQPEYVLTDFMRCFKDRFHLSPLAKGHPQKIFTVAERVSGFDDDAVAEEMRWATSAQARHEFT